MIQYLHALWWNIWDGSRLTTHYFISAMGQGRYLWYIPIATLLLAIGVGINKQLEKLHNPILEWSPWHKDNYIMKPMLGKHWWIYTPILVFFVPLMAFIEEYWFRNGTPNWIYGILIGGLAFGVIHFTSFAKVRMVIWLTIMGLALVGAYMVGGLIACWVLHTTYNLIAIAVTVATEKLIPALRSDTIESKASTTST